ncbi:ArsR/SmtB family transcription factor [Aureibacillus halotolerans]|uniref:ArsR family transcriptional regulator n=1 Tax=Aureibacillus halotolerans TaxID=1508390 RepID=A0A4V3D5M6_9BACI|nr:metalloregulator ArsR/SmtB family transcription factor [Aureibacillus halotolerans]TDQ40667.1 ArsR family transcriptional regulator [Aureibacillus halotolerans]
MNNEETLLTRKKELIDEIRDSTDIFKAFSDPVRQDIFLMFMIAKRMNVAEVVEQSHLSRPAISHHLKILKQAGILSSNKVKTEVFYSLNLGDSVIAKLKRIVESAEVIMQNKED